MSAQRDYDTTNPFRAAPRRTALALNDEFACESREISLKLHECLTDYVNANALRIKASPCFKCARGQRNRVDFAKGQP